ncbi:MAG: hypothetical protein AB7T06_17755 [Kofleriaceae bacterium]
MTRLAPLLLALAACDVGQVPAANVPLTDGGGGADMTTALACVDRGVAGTPHDHGAGVTHAGEACMVAGCHLAGGDGPLFAAMGTVYKADNVTPNAGAAVRIVFGGMSKVAITDTAGNFYFSETLGATFPAKTDASGCPTDPVPMLTQITSAADMNCNRAGCHDNAANRINFE